MKTTIITIITTTLLSLTGFSQNLMPFKGENGKWGYKDKEGHVVIKASYDRAYEFSEGFGIVQKNDLFGYIDTKGKEISGIKFNIANKFQDGMAVVNIGCEWGIDSDFRNICYGGKWGYINSSGQEIALEYDEASAFIDGYAFCKIKPNINISGEKEWVDSVYAEAKKETGFFLINKKGERMNKVGFEDVHGISKGLAAVNIADKWGYINTEGNKISEFIYDDARIHSPEGFARVSKDGKWGFLDLSCNVVIDIKYDSVTPMVGGLALIKEQNKWGVISKTGKEIAPIIYDYIGFSEEQKLIVLLANKKWGFMDKSGNQITSQIYEEISYPCGDNKYPDFFNDGTLGVKKDGKWGYIDETGKEFIPCKYYWVYEFREGLAAVSIGDASNFKTGFIDKTGNTVIPFDFEYVAGGCDHSGGFYNGLAAVRKNNKWGYVDKAGKMKIPCIYQNVEASFYDGKAQVTLDGRTFYIDQNGNEIKE